MHFITRDQHGTIIPPGPGTTFKWKNSDIAGLLSASQTEFATYTANPSKVGTRL